MILPRRGLAAFVLVGVIACGGDGAGVAPNRPAQDNIVFTAPEGWQAAASGGGLFQFGVDRTSRHGGEMSGLIRGSDTARVFFGSLNQGLRADAYRGKRVRLSGWVRTDSLTGLGGGLYLRADFPGRSLLDNMAMQRVTGSTDWHQISVVIDVPANAIGLGLGALMSGKGTMLIDDLKLEVVGADVALTKPGLQAQNGPDSLSAVASYAGSPDVPLNTDFEGLEPPTSQVVAWLNQHVTPLSTVDPTEPLTDLEPMGAMVGGASLVGLGEGTHGTHEFFAMKTRMVEFLVSNMGFRTFAIEANWPEANDVNQYVMTGQGDPAALLRGLHYWVWNTQEVLDLIQWIRQWNATATADQKVTFTGFDMQYVGAPIDSVLSYLAGADTVLADFATERYGCLATFRNHGNVTSPPLTLYAAQPAAAISACHAAVAEVYDSLNSRGAVLRPAAPVAYDAALHSARLVVQWEKEATVSTSSAAVNLARDSAMAENIQWLRDHGPANEKMILWAHDLHIVRMPTTMGGYLGARYGSDYIAVGMAFGQGSFNAVALGGGAATPGAQPFTAAPPRNNSIEATFHATAKDLVLFDARQIPGGGTDAAALAASTMRFIGASFSPQFESSNYLGIRLPDAFDLLVYTSVSTPTQLLPFS